MEDKMDKEFRDFHNNTENPNNKYRAGIMEQYNIKINREQLRFNRLMFIVTLILGLAEVSAFLNRNLQEVPVINDFLFYLFSFAFILLFIALITSYFI